VVKYLLRTYATKPEPIDPPEWMVVAGDPFKQLLPSSESED
jgi:hypothetical protein